MMGVAKKANTTIVERDEQELSLRAIEVLPDLLQVRANLDKGWSREYSKGYAAGHPIPPILVYRLPDERLVVTDGFHRIDACHAIGKRTIRAQIRDGTLAEALLAAIEANTAAYHRGRPFVEEDRKHAVQLMFKNQEFWVWADRKIGDYCGVSSGSVSRYRTEYIALTGTAPPEKVFTSNGRWIKYKFSPEWMGQQVNNRGKGFAFRKNIGGKTVYLGSTEDEAKKKLAEIMETRTATREKIEIRALTGFLASRFLFFRAVMDRGSNGISGRHGHGVIFTSTDFAESTSIRTAVGDLIGLREYAKQPDARLVIVCYPEDGPGSLIALYQAAGIEFLTPDELVASLKGQEGEGEGQG